MIDIGANLTNKSFNHDIEEVLERARLAGIEKIVVTGSCFESNRDALDLAKQKTNDDFLYSTAGLHPHHASDWNGEITEQIDQLLLNDSVVAIGETGLDYNRNFSDPADQRLAFQELLELAQAHNKPLFLHQRDAHNDFYSMLKAFPDLWQRAVVHCFTDTERALKDYLELGCYIGITGWICDKKRGKRLRDIVKHIPLNRLLIESDAPYLMPHRDQIKNTMAQKNRNEPCTLNHVAQQLAESLAVDKEEIINTTRNNAIRFFNL